jgi:transposase
VDLWAPDEVHFQQHGSHCRLWVSPEVRDPVLLHHPTRDSVAYVGAVRLKDERFVFRKEDDSFSKETFFAFMKQLKQAACRRGRRVVVITDNANYHHASLHKAWQLQQAGRFELHFPPPYSPDLNPIERVWGLARRLCLHNHYFPVFEHIVSAVESHFLSWSRGNSTLRRLCAII